MTGLELARPEVLWGLLLALPIVFLHLYHRRRIVVAYLPLLREAAGPRRVGAGLRRLREAISLLCRLLALVALVLVLAGLRPASATRPEPALVLVLDGDVTTRALEADDRTRHAHQVDLARGWIRSRPWRWVAVIEAGATPLTRARLSSPTDAAKALAELPLPTTAGDLDAALVRAQRVAEGDGPAQVVAITARDVPEGTRVAGVGRTTANQGLVYLSVAKAADGLRRVIEVRIRGEAEARRDLLVLVNGEEVDRQALVIPADGETSASVELLPPRGGAAVELRLDGADAFGWDDRAHLFLAAPPRASVLLVHDGAPRPYTRAALDAMGEAIDTKASGTVLALDLAKAGLRDVNVVDGARVPASAIRPGAWLFLAPLQGAFPFEVLPLVERPLVWRSDPDHPLVRDVDLSSAYVPRAWPVRGEGLDALAEADGHAVLAEGATADGIRFVVLALDPEGSDLPVRAAFPLLVRNAVRRLAVEPLDPLPPFVRPGDTLRARSALPGTAPWTLVWPGGEATADLGVEGRGFPVPWGARGPVEIRGAGPIIARTGFVDLDPTRRIRPVRDPESPPPEAPPRADVAGRWQRALLLLAAALLLLDLLVFALARRGVVKLAAPSETG